MCRQNYKKKKDKDRLRPNMEVVSAVEVYILFS